MPSAGAWIPSWVKYPLNDDVTTQEDADVIFRSTLRSDFDEQPFDFDIEGDFVWSVLDENVIDNDVVTEAQKEVLAKRAKLSRALSDKSMTKRRQALGDYFFKKYPKYSRRQCDFNTWADAMVKAENDLNELCIND